MATPKTIGSKIRKVRLAKGLSQEELAFETDIDRSYISEIETGKANFSIGFFLAICKVLKTDPKDFL